LPNATFIRFTGGPIEKSAANTRRGLRGLNLMLPASRTLQARRFALVHLAPLGSIYDIQQAVADKATVPIYYESRIAKLVLNVANVMTHFEKRVEAMDGKAMIVCMSRRICVDLYNAIIKLRPE
jgi:type I restriction enzyme R subunit